MNSLALWNRLQLRGVDITVQVALTQFRKFVQSACDPIQKPVPIEFTAPVASVSTYRAAKFVYRARCEVPILLKKLKDDIVAGNHPVGAISHLLVRLIEHAHRVTGVSALLRSEKWEQLKSQHLLPNGQ